MSMEPPRLLTFLALEDSLPFSEPPVSKKPGDAYDLSSSHGQRVLEAIIFEGYFLREIWYTSMIGFVWKKILNCW